MRSSWLLPLALGLSSAAPAKEPLLIYTPDLAQTLDPVVPWTPVDTLLHSLVHAPVRTLVESEPTDTGLTLTLHQGLRWHDGASIDAGDLCFTVEALLAPGTHSPYAPPARARIASCVTDGQDALVAHLTLTGPWSAQEVLVMPLLPQHLYTSTALGRDPRQAQPVGAGPFRATPGPPGDLLLEPVGHHLPDLLWAAGGSPAVNTQLVAAKAGASTLWVPPPSLPTARRAPHAQLIPWDRQLAWSLALDTETEGPLADPRVRQALDLLIDRPRLRAILSGGEDPDRDRHPWPLVSGPWISGDEGENRGVPVPERDPERAARLLERAGLRLVLGIWMYEEAPLTLTVAMPEGLGFSPARVRAELDRATPGIQVESLPLSRTAWWDSALAGGLAPHANAALVPRALWPSQDPGPYFHSRGPTEGWFNLFGWSDPKVDRLIEARRARPDPTQDQALHALLADAHAHLFLFEERRWMLWTDRLSPIIPSPGDGLGRVPDWGLASERP